MAKEFSRGCLGLVVASLCQNIGWKKIKPSAMELLIDLLEKYILSLAKGAHGYAEQRGSTKPVLEDLALALDDAGVAIAPLEEYIREVGVIPLPRSLGLIQLDSVPVYPVRAPSRRNGEREQHLQFFDSWAESDDDCCAHLVPPTQHPVEGNSVYTPEESVTGDDVETLGSELRSRYIDSMPLVSQTPVVAMTESGILSASRDGRQPSSRRPITPPRCSPSPDRSYPSGERVHSKKEKKKKKGKENTGIGKLKIKTGCGMGKHRSAEHHHSHSRETFAMRYAEKTKPLKPQKYPISSEHPLNSQTSKDAKQHSRHEHKNSFTPVKFVSPSTLLSSDINHVPTDSKDSSKPNLLAVPNPVSNENSPMLEKIVPDKKPLPQSTKKSEEKPKHEPLDSLQLNVPIKQEPMDNEVGLSEHNMPFHASNNTKSETVNVKTESENSKFKEDNTTNNKSFAQGQTKLKSIVNVPHSESDVSKYVSHNDTELSSQPHSSDKNEQFKCNNENSKRKDYTYLPTKMSTSTNSNSVSLDVTMTQSQIASKEIVSDISLSRDVKIKHSKTDHGKHSKKHHKSSKKRLSKEEKASHKRHHCSKKRKHIATATKTQEKTGSIWDSSLNDLFAPDIVQKNKKNDPVKDRDVILSEVRDSESIQREKLNTVPDQVQKSFTTNEVKEPFELSKLMANSLPKNSSVKQHSVPENMKNTAKGDHCISKTKFYGGEEEGSKHPCKKVKEEQPSTTGVPHWRVNAALIYSSSSDSEVEVEKPCDISFGTPPTVSIPETPKTPRTPDVPIDMYKHTKCKKVVDKTSDLHLGADLGTPPPARPPTPGVGAPMAKINKEKHKHKKKKKKHEKKHHSPKKEDTRNGHKAPLNSDLVAAECLMKLTSIPCGNHATVSSGDHVPAKQHTSSSKKKRKLLSSESKKKHHSAVTPLPLTIPSSTPPVSSTSTSQQAPVSKVAVPANSVPVSISDDGPIGFYFDEFGNRVWVCPSCGGQDDGSPMIRCDDCYAWYHWACVGIDSEPDENVDWFCSYCLSKNDRHSKKHKSSSLHRKKSHSRSSRK